MPRPIRRWRTLVAVASVLTLIIGANSCDKKATAPETSDETPTQYAPAYSPQIVLQNLVVAYQSRDSVGTDSVYDSNYEGVSGVLTFTEADEIRHVGRLKLDPNIVSVFVDLGAPSSWQVLDAGGSDPPGWKVIQITSEVIRIEDIHTSSTWEAKNNVMEFTFKPTDVPGAPAPEDTTWTVVRWTEVPN